MNVNMEAKQDADPDTRKRLEGTNMRLEFSDNHGSYYVDPGMGTGFDANKDDATIFSTTTDSQTGLQRTDNNMDLTSWPQVNMINQKNYYT